MVDYVSRPAVIRTIADKGIVIEQSGDTARINGRSASMTTREEILANPRHYLRTALGASMAQIEKGTVAAVVHADCHHLGAAAPANGRTVYILITAEQYAAGAAERARWAAWVAARNAGIAADKGAERAYDLGHNEGGEGYNPHRGGAAPTYARSARRERDYPEGA